MARERAHHRLGLVLLFAATFFTSTAGVLLRWVEDASTWSVLFWRSLFCAATLGGFLVWRYGRRLPAASLAIGRTGLWIALFQVVATVAFYFALQETTVARVVFINGLTPFVAGLLAWAVLGERIRVATWVAMLLAGLGVAVMVGDGLAGESLLGDGLAFLCCLFTSAMLVAMRRGKTGDMIPAIILAVVAVAVIAPLFTPSLAVSRHDLLICALLGIFQLGVQYMLVITATRWVPAAEVALTGRLTLILAPLWVWLAVSEVPSEATFAGGALVLAAILGHGLWNLQRSRRAA